MKRSWTELSNVLGRNDISFEYQLTLATRIEEIFRSLNIPIKNSRIASYRNALLAVKRLAENNQSFTLQSAMALLGTSVELQELGLIARAARSSPDPSSWRDHLEKLISGSHPHVGSKASSSGWDFQYEAYIASVSLLSGYDVSFNEPDLIIKDGDRIFGIAAKRPRNQVGVKRNLEKAAKQIRDSGRDGIIALDCSVIAADGQAITTTDSDSAVTAAKALCNSVLEKSLPSIKNLIGKTYILGVILSVHVPVTVVDEQWQRAVSFRSAFRWTVVPLIPFGPKHELVMNFAKRCERGLFGVSTVPEGTSEA